MRTTGLDGTDDRKGKPPSLWSALPRFHPLSLDDSSLVTTPQDLGLIPIDLLDEELRVLFLELLDELRRYRILLRRGYAAADRQSHAARGQDHRSRQPPNHPGLDG